MSILYFLLQYAFLTKNFQNMHLFEREKTFFWDFFISKNQRFFDGLLKFLCLDKVQTHLPPGIFPGGI